MIDVTSMEKQLKGRYKDVFQRVCLYGKTKKVEDSFYKDRVNNIFNKLVMAQNTLKPVEEVVGRNLEGFCRDFYKTKSIGTILQDLLRLINVISITMFVLIITNYVTAKNPLPMGEAKISMLVIVSVIIICCLIAVTSRLVNGKFKLGGKSLVVLGLFVILLVFAMDILIGFITMLAESNSFLPVLPVLIFTGVYILIYNTVNSVIRYKMYGTIKYPYKLSIKDATVNSNVPKKEDIIEASKDLQERYKGFMEKNPSEDLATQKENFCKKIDGELGKEKLIKTIIVVVCIVCVVIFSFMTYNSYGITAAGVVFTILVFLELFGAKAIFKMLREGNSATKLVVDTWRESNLSLEECAKDLTTIKKNISDKKPCK